MIALDTSVVVAAFSAWLPVHDLAVQAASSDAMVAPHVIVETYSTLTRMPEPFRASPDLVSEYLDRQWGERIIELPTQFLAGMPGMLAAAGVIGGAAYDAVIALSARHAGLPLVTLDRRAERTYRALGIDYRILA